MTFLDFMHVMFELQEKFPDMSFKVEDGCVMVTLPVRDSTAALMTDAQTMFSPR